MSDSTTTTRTTTTTTTGPRRRLAPAERRDHLLDVAASVVVDQGVEAVTMERVALHAGVSRSLPYAYFDNSDDLLHSLYVREVSQFDLRVAEISDGAKSLEDHLRGAVVAYFDMLATKGVLLTRLTDLAARVPAHEERRRGRDRQIERFYGDLLSRELNLPPKRARAVASILVKALPVAAELWGRGVLRRQEAIELFIVMATGAATAVAEHDFDGVSFVVDSSLS
jgi:AcrR family transcriptional regulator